jgi:hypothetical protein
VYSSGISIYTHTSGVSVEKKKHTRSEHKCGFLPGKIAGAVAGRKGGEGAWLSGPSSPFELSVAFLAAGLDCGCREAFCMCATARHCKAVVTQACRYLHAHALHL